MIIAAVKHELPFMLRIFNVAPRLPGKLEKPYGLLLKRSDDPRFGIAPNVKQGFNGVRQQRVMP